MKRFKIPILICGLALASFAAANQVKVELAGRVVTVDAVSVGGKTYVSLEQLKVQLGTTGGAQQLAASEGPMGDWLFNGVWRLKVDKVSWDAEEDQWVVSLRVRNGTSKTRMMFNNGFADDGTSGVALALESGTTLSLGINASNLLQSEITMKELPPGGETHSDLRFSGKAADKPVKLLVEMHSVDGLPFSAHPSFRVDLKSTK